MRHRSPRPRLPWWVHLTVLILILGSTAASVLTGNPLYGLVGCPGGYALGSALSTARGRRRLGELATALGAALIPPAGLVATMAVTGSWPTAASVGTLGVLAVVMTIPCVWCGRSIWDVLVRTRRLEAAVNEITGGAR